MVWMKLDNYEFGKSPGCNVVDDGIAMDIKQVMI